MIWTGLLTFARSNVYNTNIALTIAMCTPNMSLLMHGDRLRDEAAAMLETTTTKFQAQIDSQRSRDEQIQAMLTGDKDRLESENSKLREQLLQATAQVCIKFYA